MAHPDPLPHKTDTDSDILEKITDNLGGDARWIDSLQSKKALAAKSILNKLSDLEAKQDAEPIDSSKSYSEGEIVYAEGASWRVAAGGADAGDLPSTHPDKFVSFQEGVTSIANKEAAYALTGVAAGTVYKTEDTGQVMEYLGGGESFPHNWRLTQLAPSEGAFQDGDKTKLDTLVAGNKPDGYVKMVSTKTSNISVRVEHDGTDSATGICYSVDGGAPVYQAKAADTNTNLSIPHNGGAPVEIYIWSATSASSGRVGNLTILNCYNDSLTSLDVSGLTALTYLSCGVSSLTSLDVSGLTALTSLYCNSNSLTSIDVSGLTALSTLSCSSNSLTSLDVSGLTALTYLTCNSNSLTSLLATGVDLSYELYGLHGSDIGDNNLSEAALIAFVDSLATTTTGVISYGGNTGSAAFETWLATGDDKGYIWLNS